MKIQAIGFLVVDWEVVLDVCAVVGWLEGEGDQLYAEETPNENVDCEGATPTQNSPVAGLFAIGELGRARECVLPL